MKDTLPKYKIMGVFFSLQNDDKELLEKTKTHVLENGRSFGWLVKKLLRNHFNGSLDKQKRID